MKTLFRPFIYILLLLAFNGCGNGSSVRDIAVIPQVNNIVYGDGTLKLFGGFKPVYETGLRDGLDELLAMAGLGVSETGSVELEIRHNGGVPAEGYILEIDRDGVRIETSDESGIFYAGRTLAAIVLSGDTREEGLPYLRIEDSPRFAYRGVLLDVSGHYFSPEYIMKKIDVLAMLKMNRLLLYFGGRDGWNLYLESFPWLTGEVTARTLATSSGMVGEGIYYPGQIAEIVAYARKSFVEIIPAFDLPFTVPYLMEMYSDFPIEDPKVLTDLSRQVVEIFDAGSVYIGNGGAVSGRGTDCVSCLPRVARGDMTDASMPENSALRAIRKALKGDGVEVISWESSVRGTLEDGSTVIAWHEVAEGIQAAGMGYKVIMSPSDYSSFDYYQNDPTSEPEAMSGFLPLRRLYGFLPVTPGTAPEIEENIAGVQFNMWTRFTPNPEQVEYMLYPRLLAASEVAWSTAGRKSYPDFRRRAELYAEWLIGDGLEVFDLDTENLARPGSDQRTSSIATGKTVKYGNMFETRFQASGRNALTDGERGGWFYGDGRWQGFMGTDVDVTLDLEEVTGIRGISTSFISDPSTGVILPLSVELLGSEDGQSYFLVGGMESPVPGQGYSIVDYDWNGNTTLRYLRLIARFGGGAGQWMFLDELIVR